MMSDNFNPTLYYYYGSSCSQKVLLALIEKGCKFERKIIDIRAGEQNEPEYMRMNPNGVVPVLKHGQKIIIESERIVDYICEHVKSGPQLIPDENTPIGQEVKKIRQYFDNVIKIGIATYGVINNEEFSVTGIKMPKMMLKQMKDIKAMEKMFESLKEKADKYPDLRDAYLTKLEQRRKFISAIQDKEEVAKCLDDLEKNCDLLEESLKKSKAAASSGEEFWLTGPQYTAADVAIVIFIDRLTMLGLDGRYFTKEKRPLLNNYCQKIGQRKAVQMMREDVKKTAKKQLWKKVKSVIPYVASAATLGVAVGVGIWFLKNK